MADQPVLLAYLFGSTVTGQTHDESDIDVALYFNPSLDKSERFEAQMLALGVLAKAFHVDSDHLNTTRLSDAPHLLQLVVISEGKLIFERDRGVRLDFELRVRQEEDDQQSFRNTYNTRYLQRLAGQAP